MEPLLPIPCLPVLFSHDTTFHQVDRLFGITGGNMRNSLILLSIWILMTATIMGIISPDQRDNLIILFYSTGGPGWTNNT